MILLGLPSLLVIQSGVFVLAGPASMLARLPQGEVLGFDSPNPPTNAIPDLKQRQETTTFISTCGYVDGDPSQPRTANSGFDCRSDTLNALWGFCPTTVIAATDCGLAGYCIDLHSCSSGCGISNNPSITTFTCTNPSNDYCSSAVLTDDASSSYTYIACGAQAAVDHLLETTTTSSASPSLLTYSTSTTAAPSSLPSAPASASFTSTSLSSSNTPPSTISSSTVSASSSPKASPTTATPIPSSPSSNNVGAIVGGIIGGLALICFVVLAVIFLRRYRALPNDANSRLTHIPPSQPYDRYMDRYNNGLPKNPYGDNKAELASDSPAFSTAPVELPSYRH